MALSIEHAPTDLLARELAAPTGESITDALRPAIERDWSAFGSARTTTPKVTRAQIVRRGRARSP